MLLLTFLLAAATLESFAPNDVWGGRVRHPAVVNSPVQPASPDVLSLNGEWDFATRRHHLGGVGLASAWGGLEAHRTYRKIRVPGIWEAQGVGEPARGNRHLNLDCAEKDLRHVFTGQGLYRKVVRIPSAWAGKRIWLKIGGVSCRGYFEINGKSVAMLTTYGGAWKYDVTDLVRPGQDATICAMVDNAVGSRNTQPNNADRWGGLTRDIELEATPQTFIDDVWVRGAFDAKQADVKVTVGLAADRRAEGTPHAVRVTIEGQVSTESVAVAAVGATSSTCSLRLPLANFRPWSPQAPNLYTAKVELVSNGEVVQTRYTRFGVRKFEARGKSFFLNGKPFYLRGFGDDSTYPITGISPCDRDFHRRHLARAKAAGFNCVRLHTHCEMPEYMDACDELGILVQLELSYYLDMPMDHFDYDPKRDVDDRFVAYRNHPSWCIASGGNEGKVGPAAGALVYEYIKRTDPDRLVQEEDGPTGPDEYGRPVEDFCTGPMKVWQRGAFDPPMPFVCHEYLNLSVKQDSRLEPQFTGVWKPLETRERRAERLAAAGLTHAWGDRFQDAQHALQKIFQKDGIERARLDPFCDGYFYWTIVDVGVENANYHFFTAQGLFDVFWNPKRNGSTPASFAVFNSPTCVLCDFCHEEMPTNPVTAFTWSFTRIWSRMPDTNRVFVAGETIAPTIKFAHFGAAPVTDARLDWKLASSDDRVLAAGAQALGDQALGGVRDLAPLSIVVPSLAHPCAAKLAATVSGRMNGKSVQFANDWDVYLFPQRKAMDGSAMACADEFFDRLAPRYPGLVRARAGAGRPILICKDGAPEEDRAIKAGRRVITLAGQTGKPNYALGWWWIGEQVGTTIVKNPVLGDFPTGDCLSPLYFRIIKSGTELPSCGIEEKNLVIAGEGGKGFYLYLAVESFANGAERVRISGLDVLSETPEGVSLLDNAVRHLMVGGKKDE